MADLPPLARLPENGVSPELVGQLEHSANWARNFGGMDTNIAQRFRHNQDIEQYAGVLQAQREQAQEQLLQKSKAAQSLYFGRQKLDLAEREAKARMAHEEELHPLKMKAMEMKAKADMARERATTEATLLKHENDLRTHASNEAFAKRVREARANGIENGTPEWADVLTTARLENPGMSSEFFDDEWKGTARSPLSPQEAMEFAVEKKKRLMAVDPKDSPDLKAAERDRNFYQSQLSRAESRRNAANDEDTKKLFDEDIRDFKTKRDEAESQLRSFREGKTAPAPGQPAAAPAPAASPAAPDKLALAKKALDDPNASEVHKAAARKILGL